MPLTRFLFAGLVALSLVAGHSVPVFAAENDVVTRIGTTRNISGQITSISRTEVVVTQPITNREERIPANEIVDIEWKREPGSWGLARGYEKSGNLDQALAGYTETLAAVPVANRDPRADLEFRIARVFARIARSNPEKLPEAVQRLQAWSDGHRDHFRYYEAQRLLADAALSQMDFLAADAAFARLEQAPWLDTQLAGKIGLGRVALAQGNLLVAKSQFDQVAATEVTNALQKSVRLQALLGQAECLRRQSAPGEAAVKLQAVIDETGPDDARTLADAYVQLGHCHAADAQHLKDAVLAFLHVDVVPALAAYPELHAESLYQLSKLWPAIGQPARGLEAAERLKQQYPGSDWTRKLETSG